MKSLNDIYQNIERKAKQPFMVAEKETLNYTQLLIRMRQFVGLFDHYQVQTGQRIIICTSDESFIVSATAAGFFHGIASVVLTSDTSLSRAQSIIKQAEPALVLLDEQLQSAWQLSGAFEIFSIVKSQSSGSSLLKRFKRKSSSSWLNTLAEFEQSEPALPSDHCLNCFINFTSGTTGAPKGVQISYNNLLVHLQTLSDTFQYSENSRILNNMILAHADGLLQGPLLTLFNACTLYRPYSMDVQHLELLLNTIHRERITHMITVPTILSFMDRLAAHDDYFHSDDFCHLVSVAGMLDVNIWKRLEQRFSVRICNIYGLTETVAGGIFCGPGDHDFRHATVGKPIDMDIRIVDNEGNDVAAGEQGELLLKGENVFSGYFNAPDRTAEVFTDQWFHSGDIAKFDSDGFVNICGRTKELIITGGFNVHPAEVSEALLRHSAVAEASTLGIPDPDWQEVVICAVVLKAGISVDEHALINHCRQWLEPKKVPRKIYFLSGLPKGDAGKVKLPQLREQIDKIATQENSALIILDENTLIELAAEIFQVDKAILSLQSKAGETPGWDSMGHLNLVIGIEKKLDKKLNAQQIMAITTLSDVLSLVHEA
jgi:long-chain acyl-CoA synthetase